MGEHDYGDLENIFVECSSTKELVARTNDIIRQLGGDLGRDFSRVIREYLVADFDNVYRKLNGMSVAEILSESSQSKHVPSRRIVADGEKDGIRFTLYEAPNETSEDSEDEESVE